MAFSITNVGKAKDLLKKAKIDSQILNGNDEKIKIQSEIVLSEILKTGDCALFEALDEAGRLLKESLLTRSTAHKKYDYSSIQSDSSRNLRYFYKKILNNIPSDVFKSREHPLDSRVEKEIRALDKKLTESLNEIQKIIVKNKEIGDYIKKQLGIEQATKDTLDKLDQLIPPGVAFIDQNKVRAADDLRKENLTTSLKAVGFGALASVATSLVVGGGLYGLGVLGDSFVIAALGVSVGVGTAGVGLAVSLVVAAGFLVAALVVHCNKERFGTIALKRAVIKINDEFTNALKYLNKAADLVRKNAKTTAPDGEQEPKPTDEQKKILKSFVAEQNQLWKPYTTAQGREYNKSDEDKEKGTHKTGLITVKDAKTSNIGKMKEGIAKTWSGMSV